MPRPHCCRRIAGEPPCAVFKPAGVPARDLPVIVLGLDELEALRLADLEGLYQEQVAERMGVSRSTVTRILEAARRKVAGALVQGHALRIEGGPVSLAGEAGRGGGRGRARRAGPGRPCCSRSSRGAAGDGGARGATAPETEEEDR